jgi:hypothetical protein
MQGFWLHSQPLVLFMHLISVHRLRGPASSQSFDTTPQPNIRTWRDAPDCHAISTIKVLSSQIIMMGYPARSCPSLPSEARQALPPFRCPKKLICFLLIRRDELEFGLEEVLLTAVLQLGESPSKIPTDWKAGNVRWSTLKVADKKNVLLEG